MFFFKRRRLKQLERILTIAEKYALRVLNSGEDNMLSSASRYLIENAWLGQVRFDIKSRSYSNFCIGPAFSAFQDQDFDVDLSICGINRRTLKWLDKETKTSAETAAAYGCVTNNIFLLEPFPETEKFKAVCILHEACHAWCAYQDSRVGDGTIRPAMARAAEEHNVFLQEQFLYDILSDGKYGKEITRLAEKIRLSETDRKNIVSLEVTERFDFMAHGELLDSLFGPPPNKRAQRGRALIVQCHLLMCACTLCRISAEPRLSLIARYTSHV